MTQLLGAEELAIQRSKLVPPDAKTSQKPVLSEVTSLEVVDVVNESVTLLCWVAVAAVMFTDGEATVIVEVSTSTELLAPNWSVVVMVSVGVPAVLLVYVTVASAALILAKVPVNTRVPVPVPVRVVLPAVAFKVPDPAANVTFIVDVPASLSAMLRPLKVVVVLISTAYALGSVLTGAWLKYALPAVLVKYDKLPAASAVYNT